MSIISVVIIICAGVVTISSLLGIVIIDFWARNFSSFRYDIKDTLEGYEVRHQTRLNRNEWIRWIQTKNFDRRRQQYIRLTEGVRANDSIIHEYGFCKNSGEKIKAVKEFGYIIELFVGYAHFLHMAGCLDSVESFESLKPLFFFVKTFHNYDSIVETNASKPDDSLWTFDDMSDDHPAKAMWSMTTNKDRYANMARGPHYPEEGYQYPAFREFYRNGFFANIIGENFKPVAMVTGKWTAEWGGPPINTFAKPEDLKRILDVLLANEYLIVYGRSIGGNGTDMANQLNFDDNPGDEEMIRNHYIDQDVILLSDIYRELTIHKSDDMTPKMAQLILQMLAMANAEIFVTTQGGNAVLASLFGHDNFVLHRAGSEVSQNYEHNFYRRFTTHGGQRLIMARSVDGLVDSLNAHLKSLQAIQSLSPI